MLSVSNFIHSKLYKSDTINFFIRFCIKYKSEVYRYIFKKNIIDLSSLYFFRSLVNSLFLSGLSCNINIFNINIYSRSIEFSFHLKLNGLCLQLANMKSESRVIDTLVPELHFHCLLNLF